MNRPLLERNRAAQPRVTSRAALSGLHWVDPDSGEIVNKPIKRAMFLEHFANRTLIRSLKLQGMHFALDDFGSRVRR